MAFLKFLPMLPKEIKNMVHEIVGLLDLFRNQFWPGLSEAIG